MGYGPAILEYGDPRVDEAVGEPPLLPYGEGVPDLVKRLIHKVPLNDAGRLEDTLKRHHGDIGALLIEPIMGNCRSIAATEDYLRAARARCDWYGVVMIIDEVKTGLRVARGGVQELMSVEADLCTFAKAVANGYPLSVPAGREDIMRKIGQGVAHSVSLAAAEKTLEILDETPTLADIADYGTRLLEGMSAILAKRGHHPSATPAWPCRIDRSRRPPWIEMAGSDLRV